MFTHRKQTFYVDYCDCREAVNAFKALNNRTILGARYTLVQRKNTLDPPFQLEYGGVSGANSVRYTRTHVSKVT